MTGEEAIERVLSRREARRNLAAWSRACGFEPAAHHLLLIDHLEKVARGEIKRLLILMPPGSAKSTYASVLFPPWFLAQKSSQSILCASCNKRLADKFGRLSRNIIDDHENVLGYSLAKDSQAVDDWGTSNGSIYFCAGVDTRIAGHRADLGLIDDAVGSIEDADSQLMREGVWDWYQWSFIPRLKPNAGVVVIGTPWHFDDFLGRLQDREKGRWTILRLPMEAVEPDPLMRSSGALLWPEYFNETMVSEAKANPRKWQAAYMLNPTPETGDYFREEWLVGYEPHNLPKALTIYCASDHACSTNEVNRNDRTWLVPFGVDEGQNVWILPDVFYGRHDTGTVVDEMIKIIRRRDPVAWVAETEHIVKSIGPFLRQRLKEEELFRTRLQEISSKRDKPAKARSIQGRMESRKVFFPKFAPWWSDAHHEIITAWSGVHDDFPDVLSVIGRYLDKYMSATPESEEKPSDYFTLGWLKRRNHQKTMAIESLLGGM